MLVLRSLLMSIGIEIENYRVLKKVAWELPKGVCPLVGPNGSGKTTLLRSFRFLRQTLANGIEAAIQEDGGLEEFARIDAGGAPVGMRLTLDQLSWHLEIRTGAKRSGLTYGERALVDGQQVLSREPGADSFSISGEKRAGGAAFRQLAFERFPSEDPREGAFGRPVSILSGYRLYEPIAVEQLRGGSRLTPWRALVEGGENLFAVMRNWNDRRESRGKLDFIKSTLQEAFPDIFEDMDFDSDKERVTCRLHQPGASRPLPMSAAPMGLLNMLFVLCAVVSTERGGLVAIDEPENALHPFAIQKLVDAARAWAADEDLTVLLATHSLTLLDRFKDEPEQIFVMEPGQESLPVRLSELHARDWLAQFSLGDLYKFGDFGAPVPAGATS